MKYHYTCSTKDKRCQIQNLPDTFFDGEMDLEIAVESKAIEVAGDGGIDMGSPLVWVVTHMMTEDPEILCPVCESVARKVIQQVKATYIKGNGYLDKKGCMRDMNLYKLQKDDPYGYMRQAGEKDDLVRRLKAGGKHQKNTKHYYSGKRPS